MQTPKTRKDYLFSLVDTQLNFTDAEIDAPKSVKVVQLTQYAALADDIVDAIVAHNPERLQSLVGDVTRLVGKSAEKLMHARIIPAIHADYMYSLVTNMLCEKDFVLHTPEEYENDKELCPHACERLAKKIAEASANNNSYIYYYDRKDQNITSLKNDVADLLGEQYKYLFDEFFSNAEEKRALFHKLIDDCEDCTIDDAMLQGTLSIEDQEDIILQGKPDECKGVYLYTTSLYIKHLFNTHWKDIEQNKYDPDGCKIYMRALRSECSVNPELRNRVQVIKCTEPDGLLIDHLYEWDKMSADDCKAHLAYASWDAWNENPEVMKAVLHNWKQMQRKIVKSDAARVPALRMESLPACLAGADAAPNSLAKNAEIKKTKRLVAWKCIARNTHALDNLKSSIPTIATISEAKESFMSMEEFYLQIYDPMYFIDLQDVMYWNAVLDPTLLDTERVVAKVVGRSLYNQEIGYVHIAIDKQIYIETVTIISRNRMGSAINKDLYCFILMYLDDTIMRTPFYTGGTGISLTEQPVYSFITPFLDGWHAYVPECEYTAEELYLQVYGQQDITDIQQIMYWNAVVKPELLDTRRIEVKLIDEVGEDWLEEWGIEYDFIIDGMIIFQYDAFLSEKLLYELMESLRDKEKEFTKCIANSMYNTRKDGEFCFLEEVGESYYCNEEYSMLADFIHEADDERRESLIEYAQTDSNDAYRQIIEDKKEEMYMRGASWYEVERAFANYI